MLRSCYMDQNSSALIGRKELLTGHCVRAIFIWCYWERLAEFILWVCVFKKSVCVCIQTYGIQTASSTSSGWMSRQKWAATERWNLIPAALLNECLGSPSYDLITKQRVVGPTENIVHLKASLLIYHYINLLSNTASKTEDFNKTHSFIKWKTCKFFLDTGVFFSKISKNYGLSDRILKE